MAKYTEARKNANKAWDGKNLDRISVAMPKGRKDIIKSYAESKGESHTATSAWYTVDSHGVGTNDITGEPVDLVN